MARQRDTIADKVRLVLDAPDANVTPLRSRADPRLVSLVRLLARQAARDFVNAEVEAARQRDHQD
ncbi:hypothetical protein [Kozakia baliensis]|uniref:Uncharacterized protein n=1 Tax=Kozakia baliensis TaxID=153496 RepID=A0A1D8USF7_9PROT|nr:hypothetical protein [Kozakia baliensis]AOX16568.1 hypothetical protein A0U89_04890 [Kozakia baliensis]GBR26809.1 hypothetical protein AA0488_0990 [Kozakia baliensis NRIC 0488]GEL65776.1 hypothetical protein KBA01_30620 [Kozakia baliensis]